MPPAISSAILTYDCAICQESPLLKALVALASVALPIIMFSCCVQKSRKKLVPSECKKEISKGLSMKEVPAIPIIDQAVFNPFSGYVDKPLPGLSSHLTRRAWDEACSSDIDNETSAEKSIEILFNSMHRAMETIAEEENELLNDEKRPTQTVTK
ncbi:hypothetical protein M514_20360, partial [Trichuris suis]